MRHIKGVWLPPSDNQSFEEESLSRQIQEYCSRMHEHRQCERETHYVMLDSMKEHKARQSNKVREKEMRFIGICLEI